MTAYSTGTTTVPATRFPQPMAVPERLRGARRPQPGEPIWVVHGPGVTDQLVGADLRVRDIEELLWEMLHDAGYERIVFSSFRQSVYFRDSRSRDLTRQPTAPAEQDGARGMRLFTGPLGRRVIVTDLPTPATSPAARTEPAAASDPQRLKMLDSLMVSDAVATAVVVPATDTLLHNVQHDMRRPLAEMLGRWVGGQVGGRNACVLLFSQPELNDVVELVRDLRYLPQLANHLATLAARRAAPTVSRIDLPEEAELSRLLQVIRLRDGLAIEQWAALPYLTRVMAAQHVKVRTWLPHLRAMAKDKVALSVAELTRRDLATVAIPDSRALWERLDSMTGLRPVKEFLAAHRHTLMAKAALREQGRGVDADPAALHLVFTGNPGTGKTTVARMIGELYRELGLLPRGHLVDASIDELVSPYVGDTAGRVKAKVREALDGVLFVDEAYRLSDQRSGHGGEAIDVLLSEMENHRDRLAVIVAGYPDKMAEFLSANPGLDSRFPLGNRVEFPDYIPEELHEILLGRLDAEGLRWSSGLSSALLKVVTTQYRTRNAKNFGNARSMRELAERIVRQWASRTRAVDGQVPDATEEDIPAEYQPLLAGAAPLTEVLSELDELVGLAAVKDSVRRMAAVLEMRKHQPNRPDPVAPHMIFKGSPGTGKTTVARLMGRVFAALGLLYSGHVVVATRADLVAEYVGQSAPKTRAKAMEALDGVLFIDEAYALHGGGKEDFGAEVLRELLTIMLDYRGRLVVIMAGYPEQMDALVRATTGIESRIGEHLVFEDYSLPELRLIFQRLATRQGFELEPDVLAGVVRWLAADRERTHRQGEHFANARTVENLFGIVDARLALRLLQLPEAQRATEATLIRAVDVPDPGQVS